MNSLNYMEKLLDGVEVEWKSLGEVCDYVDYRGKTPKKTTEGVFLVTAKNIRMGYIDYKTSQEFISADDYNLVMRRGLPEIGDVLITTEAPCGFVAQVDREDIALAQRVIKYRSKNKLLLNSFLKHYLKGCQFQVKLQNAATGSTVKGIKGSKLHKLTIPIPPPKSKPKSSAFWTPSPSLQPSLQPSLHLAKSNTPTTATSCSPLTCLPAGRRGKWNGRRWGRLGKFSEAQQ